VHLRVVPSADSARLEVASRTDRGVSARANAFAFDTELASEVLLRSLNGISTEITCTAAALVPAEFRARRAVRRTYRYFEPLGEHDPDRWERAARLFRGTIDVRSFGRGLPAGTPVERSLESVTVAVTDGGIVVEVRAPSFVWGMVRKIVGTLREYDAGRIALSRIEAALRGEERLTLPMAEPEGLVLWDVEYPIPWTLRWTGPNRHQRERMRSMADALWVESQLVRALAVD